MAKTHFSGPVVYGDTGTVTQLTSATTAVTLNRALGQITTVVQNIAAAGEVSFTVNNSLVEATMVPRVAVASGAVVKTIAAVTAVAAGSFQITLTNLDAAVAETGTLVINFQL